MCIANPVTCIWETRTHRRLKPMALCSFTFQPTCQGSIPCVCRMAKMPQRGPNTERYDSYALGDGRQMARLVTEVSHLLPSWWEVGRTRMITFIARICPGNNSQRTGPSIRPCLWRLVLFSGTLESREKSHSSVWGHCWECSRQLGPAAHISTLLPLPTPIQSPGLGKISEEWLHIAWERCSSWYELFVRCQLTILPDQTPSSSHQSPQNQQLPFPNPKEAI